MYYVVLAIVEIHISAEEAARAGVFGVLGEEPIRLVDPRDTATIAEFRDVWRRHQSESPSSEAEPDVAKLFSTVVDAADAYYARRAVAAESGQGVVVGKGLLSEHLTAYS